MVRVIDETKLIFFLDCTCPDFSGVTTDKEGKPKYIGSKRIKEYSDFADKKFYAEPCKHLKPVVDALIGVGYTLKKPKPMEGTDKPTKALIDALISRSEGMCEANCGREGNHAHRNIRGSNGGKYNEWNCRWLCPECHREIHKNEFSGARSK